MNNIPVLNYINFHKNSDLINGHEILLVVKSQDQKVRRERLLAGRKDGKFGRTKPRPTAVGLLVKSKPYYTAKVEAY